MNIKIGNNAKIRTVQEKVKNAFKNADLKMASSKTGNKYDQIPSIRLAFKSPEEAEAALKVIKEKFPEIYPRKKKEGYSNRSTIIRKQKDVYVLVLVFRSDFLEKAFKDEIISTEIADIDKEIDRLNAGKVLLRNKLAKK